MTPADVKKRDEMKVFNAFAELCPLKIDPGSAYNEDPPLPDISCRIDGQPHHFELGRVLDRNMAQRRARTMKTRVITGGAFSQDGPLIRILEQKAAKTYPVRKESLDLLIYYDEQVPLPEALFPETRGRLLVLVQNMTLFGQFNRIWFYDHPQRRILGFHPATHGFSDGWSITEPS
ncbi:MAG: hypothetical protein ACREA2_09210 [Blastocatellia bacterium]